MMKMNITLFGETCQHTLEPNQSNRKMTLTVKELAEELNISRNTAYQLADQKDFPSFPDWSAAAHQPHHASRMAESERFVEAMPHLINT